MNLLLVIDMQKTFINENTEYLINRIESVLNKYEKVVSTRFINTNNSIYAKELCYYGCIGDDSKKIVIDTKDNMVIDKNIYTAYNKKIVDYIIKNNITFIYLCGVDIDCCVLKTAFDFFENGYNVFVLKDLCASTNGENMKTSRKKFKQKVKTMKIWLYENRDVKTKDLIKSLNRKLLGHYHYYGVSNNGRMMYNFRQRTIEILFKILNKRSNRRSYSWNRLNKKVYIY